MNLKTIEKILQNAQIILQKDNAEKKENEAIGEYGAPDKPCGELSRC